MSGFAVQSYCFRGFDDNATVAKMAREIGVDGIELYNKHGKFDDEAAADEVIETYRAAGVAIVSVGVEAIGTDEAALRKRFEFMRKAGAKRISVAFRVEATEANYRLLEKLCDEYDVYAGLHNHGGAHWQGSSDAIQRLFDRTNERVGLCLDTAWALDAGEDPVAMAERFAARLYSVHVKDFIFDRARNHQDVIVGEGNLDMPKLFATLKRNGFDGPRICEYEADIDNPVPALAKCIAAMHAV
jgi:sugar phosphate isomerase/epimerase